MSKVFLPYVKKRPNTFEKYSLLWPTTTDPIALEMHMIQKGGEWKGQRGQTIGKGLFFHFKEFQSLLWPHIKWHKWNELCLECYLKYRTIGCIGPASSGKSFNFAVNALSFYYCFSDCTTILCCSTTREMLEQRIWGEIKRHHLLAIRKRPWIPGHIIESRQRIVTDDRTMAAEGRDFRNGLLGVPCKKGNDMVGLGDFAGVKNKHVQLLADELSLLPRVFVDSISNLDKNPDFKGVGLGNPKDVTDALGVFCEPSAVMGGWDGGIDQNPGTKTWETRRPQGICIQLPGSDSPNLDGKLGIPIINQQDMDRDMAFYGKDSIWFTMMNDGKMPRGQGSRRVLTRNMCIKHRSTEDPIWKGSKRTKVAFLDAAYKAVGGDRCVYGELEFGEESDPITDMGTLLVETLVNQKPPKDSKRMIIALLETTVVPITANSKDEAEEQIVAFVQNRCQSGGIPAENFFYDSGMRTGLVSAMGRLWSAHTNPVDCGGPATETKVSEQIDMLCKDYYYNFITELWYSVRHTVEAGQWRGFTEDVIMEFSQREWMIVGKNKIQVEPKANMKLKTGRSPDLADAVAVGLHGAKKMGFVISRLVNAAEEAKRGDWMKELLNKQRELRRSQELNYST
jgi:hypothetical protein